MLAQEGSGTLTLPVSQDKIICEKELGGERIDIDKDAGNTVISISGKCYISSDIPVEEMRKVFL